jgi:hypothetical protein
VDTEPLRNHGGENTMMFRMETTEWKDDSTNISRKEQVMVSKLRTRATRRLPSPECLFCVAHNRAHAMGVYGNYERERRGTRTTKEVWTNGTEGLKRLFRTYEYKELQREEYKWTRMLIKKKKER